ncbi:hypothetical protein, partial [Escherichia coli]|uniref:hypothetical protein n=2 Tax=Gammaproteobacteria TaxID=1236 RepID=UPI00248B09A0
WIKSKLRPCNLLLKNKMKLSGFFSYRTDMILNMLSALTAALGGTNTNVYREVVIQQIDKFEKTIAGINAHLAEQEKDHALMAISSVALPKVE